MESTLVTTGRYEVVFQDDTGEFEDALTFCRRAGYRPELAWSCCDYADSLAIGHEEASQRFRRIRSK